jgi:Zn-dependent protease
VKRETLIVVGLLVAIAALAIGRGTISKTSVVLIAAVVPSIILHEISHGVVALAFGDDTAKRAGRLTLNPIKHIDPFGTLILPALLSLSGVGVFGYAKPVPVNVGRLRHPRNESLLVSLAGPTTNIVLCLITFVWVRTVHPSFLSFTSGPMANRFIFIFGYVNVLLAVFNLLPIPPLDGSALVERLLPSAWLPTWYRIRPYGLLILLVLVFFTGVVGTVVQPFFDGLRNFVVS